MADPVLKIFNFEVNGAGYFAPKFKVLNFEVLADWPPAQITDFTAVGAGAQVDFTWTNPADADLGHVLVKRKIGSYPTDMSDGTTVYTNPAPVPGAPVVAADATAIPGQLYYFAVFSADTALNWNNTVTAGLNAATATVPAAGAPDLITDFVASDNIVGKVCFNWTNPPNPTLGQVIVRRKAGSYPADHTDGTLVYTDAAPTPGDPNYGEDATAVVGTTYYFAVFGASAGGDWQDGVVPTDNADTGAAVAVLPHTTPGGGLWAEGAGRTPDRMQVFSGMSAPAWATYPLNPLPAMHLAVEIEIDILLNDVEVQALDEDGTWSASRTYPKGSHSVIKRRVLGFRIRDKVAGSSGHFQILLSGHE